MRTVTIPTIEDFLSEEGVDQVMRTVVLLIALVSSCLLSSSLVDGGASARLLTMLSAVALTLSLSILVRRYVLATASGEDGVLIHHSRLPDEIDQFMVIVAAWDQDVGYWLMTIKVQGRTKRWLVWANRGEIRSPDGKRELKQVHSGFEFSRAQRDKQLTLMNYNVRGLEVASAE